MANTPVRLVGSRQETSISISAEQHKWVAKTFGVDPETYPPKTTQSAPPPNGKTEQQTGQPGPDGPERQPFSPPPQSRQPTLRPGDESPDGWVEYMQELLKVEVTGKYDGATEKAVKAFQGANGCKVDGIVGNQTWSVLRHEKKEKIGTDGRAAHSFEEKGAEARFFTADKFAIYSAATDSVSFTVESVGDADEIAGHVATFRITPPGSTNGQVVEVPIGKATETSPTGEGNKHALVIEKFKATYPAESGAAGAYKIEAYLDAELGGDRWSGEIVDHAPAPPQPRPHPQPHPHPPPGPGPQPPQPPGPTPPGPTPPGPTPPAPPAPEPSLIDLIKRMASIATRAFVEMESLKFFLEKNAVEIALHCPMASAKFGASLGALYTAGAGLVAALAGDAVVVAEEVTLPATIGLIWAVVKAANATYGAGKDLVACLDKNDGDGGSKAIAAGLDKHLETIKGLEKELEGLAGAIKKKLTSGG